MQVECFSSLVCWPIWGIEYIDRGNRVLFSAVHLPCLARHVGKLGMQSIGNRENMEKWLFQVSCPESMDCFIGFSPQETIDFPIFIWGVPFQKNPPTTNPSPLSVLILQCCRVALGDDDLRKTADQSEVAPLLEDASHGGVGWKMLVNHLRMVLRSLARLPYAFTGKVLFIFWKDLWLIGGVAICFRYCVTVWVFRLGHHVESSQQSMEFLSSKSLPGIAGHRLSGAPQFF